MTDKKQEFISKFNVERHGFSSPVSFTDGFGFSTSKERSQGKYTFVSLYKFYISEKELKKKVKLKSIVAAVSYGEKLEDGTIRLSPTSIKRKKDWPIDLSSTDEFFYDSVNLKFYYKKKEITTEELIEEIEHLHTKPTRLWTGFLLRTKLFFWRNLITNLFKFFYYALIKILYAISGTKTTQSIWLVIMKRDSIHEDEDVKIESFAKEKINIFGYKASAWSVVVYSIIHFGLYALWYFYFDIRSNFIKNIFTNTFLTITYVIPSLVLFERLMPILIKWLIKHSGSLFHRASFKKVKI